ncbi:hypothetical protein [Mycobacterium vicinigordonae]|uniref:DUF559 domain-containing protein n=1 Tax=Mycobacterium vicinigordonae TaxID=1719132 RepID=A0A7D6DZH4_9MYCO|nr:hypothetical protein [Mycobacterium vicinigordonae]QLL08504.1 hypothetical protein H0P51_06080 [Mycobacterium vicinigordonae]
MRAELCQLLNQQGGVVTAAQALSVLSRRNLETCIRRGELRRIWRGVYGSGRDTTTLRLRGLDLLAGTTVATCLHTAAAAYGFDTESDADLHVLNPGCGHLHSAPGLVVHRREGAPLTAIRGRPTTTPAWTAIEVARGLRRPRALATLDAALRSGTCSRDELAAAVELQAGRRGIRTARELLVLASPLAESPMESEARLVMIDGGLPEPVLQYKVVDLNGRLWRVDFAWPECRVVAEYDGVDSHRSAEAFKYDRLRTASLQDLGLVVVAMVAEDVRFEPWHLVSRLRTRLDYGRAAGPARAS